MLTPFNRVVLWFTAFAASLLVYRICKTENLVYIFLAWNLFLAFIPYWISSWLKKKNEIKLIHFPILCLWIVFLPNSPYIITDLFHLKHRDPMPLWYDLVLVYSFALIGFVLFYRSAMDIIALTKTKMPENYFQFILPVFFSVIAFGLYMGRYLRFNSWDIVHHPFRLVYRSYNALFCKDAIGFTLIFAVFMWFVYLTLVTFNSKEKT